MASAPWTPYMNACSLLACGVGDTGFGAFGKITDVEVYPVLNGEFFIFYTIDTLGEDPNLFAVYLFEDGVCTSKSKSGQFVYRPDRSRANPEIELYLFPDQEGWDGFSGGGLYIDRDQVKLRWTHGAGSVDRVNILHNPGGTINPSLSPKGALVQPVLSVATAEAPFSGGRLYAAGKWTDKKVKTASILVEIVTAGLPGTAEYQWTLGEYTSPVLTVQSRPTLIGNGVRVWFEAGVSYQTGDNWTLSIGIPKEWLSRPLEDGTHSFAVETVAASGAEQISNTLVKIINGFPSPPTLLSYDYLGDGVVEVSYSIPDEADIVEANFYRNRPDMDEGFIHWGPIVGLGQTATPGETLGPVEVSGLVEGVNRIVCRLTDSAGQEEQNVDWLEIILDGDDGVCVFPNAPFSIEATEIPDGKVRATVRVDSTSDLLRFYMGGLDGVDYGTEIETAANPQGGRYQAVSVEIDWTPYGSGEFLIGVRASLDGCTEENTDVWARVRVELSAPPAAVLSGEVV